MSSPDDVNRGAENKPLTPAEERVDGIPVAQFLYGIPFSLAADEEECLVGPEDLPGAAETKPSP
jgi:hypothetical protein